MKNTEIYELDHKIKKLNKLCLNYDPFSNICDPEIEKILAEFDLQKIEDPFRVTNIVLNLIEDLNKKKQKLLQ